MEEHTKDKIVKPARYQLLILLPFAFFYAAAAILGDLEKARYAGMLHNILRFLLWLAGSYAALLVLCMLISSGNAAARAIPSWPHLPARRKRPARRIVYVLFTAVCLLCYLPYFLMYYPTWFNNDAVWQLEQVLGMAPPSNHHPYFHTMILKVLFMTGYKLSGSYTGGAAFYTFVQMFVMAMVFGFLLYWLYREGARVWWLAAAVVFYALLPINALRTICMSKDTFFSAALILYAWSLVKIDPKKRSGAAVWFAAGLLVCLLRSNGFFIFTGTSVIFMAAAVHREKKLPKRALLCIAAVACCYLVYHGPVLKALHVEPPDTIEGLTMPVQHVLCAYLKGGELTEEEIAMIDRVVPVEKLEDYYHPRLFDVTKNLIREEGDQQVIADHKAAYFKLWLRVGLRNPLQYLVAQVRQTAGYWAYSVPDYEYAYGDQFMVDNPFGITTQRKVFSYADELAMHDFLMNFLDLYNKVWSLGLNTWLMVFGIAYTVYRRRSILIYVPFIMLLVSLLLATPVYNEFRYAYGLFAAFPMLFEFTFGMDAEDEKMV